LFNIETGELLKQQLVVYFSLCVCSIDSNISILRLFVLGEIGFLFVINADNEISYNIKKAAN